MKTSIFKSIFSYIITIIIIVIIYFWLDEKNLKIFYQVNFINIFISIFFAFLTYFISGVEYYYIRKRFGVSLNLKDIFLLPIVGNLWSFIFPFQGNLLFTTLFFKQKYNMKVSESFSISIYLYLVTLCFSGIFGLLFAIYNNMLFTWLGAFSLLFLINPLFVYLTNLILNNIGQTNIKFINKFQFFISSIVKNTNKLWINVRFTLIILIINIVRIFLSVVWFYWISVTLGFNLSFVAVGLISLIMSISIIIKFTPDNIGVAQLITGGLMALIGTSSEQAILITLFASATCMIIIFTIGLYGNYYYFKTINFISLSNTKINTSNNTE